MRNLKINFYNLHCVKLITFKKERIILKKRFLFIMTLSVLLIISACGGGDSSDNDGKPLKVYSTNNQEEMDVFTKVIEEGTGIKLDVLTLSTGEAWNRIQSEAPNIGADMQIGMMEGNALKAAKEDYILEIDEPESWKDIPDEYKNVEDGWYGTSFWYNMIIINKEIFEEKDLDVPETWEDLTDPQYEGEIILPDPGTAGTAYLFLSAILQDFGEEEGWDYFDQLSDNVGQYTKSGSDASLKVAQGEYAIGIDWDEPINGFINEGYPVESIIPSDGIGYNLDVNWIFKGTEQPEKAQEVLDYMGSEEFMKALAEERSMVTKPGITDDEQIEDYFIDYDAEIASDNQDDDMNKWTDKFSN